MNKKNISHYKILEKIGEGGMGVVYKAEDTKLRRTVALKFLPAELTRDEEAKERFVQEAQAAAAIDHPNICIIYEINESEGKTFISMAYIKGQSLKEKIASGPVELEEVLDIAIHTAECLQVICPLLKIQTCSTLQSIHFSREDSLTELKLLAFLYL